MKIMYNNKTYKNPHKIIMTKGRESLKFNRIRGEYLTQKLE
jgi:hypothetical protein